MYTNTDTKYKLFFLNSFSFFLSNVFRDVESSGSCRPKRTSTETNQVKQMKQNGGILRQFFSQQYKKQVRKILLQKTKSSSTNDA